MRIRKPRAIIGMTIHKIEVNIIIVSETTNGTTSNKALNLNIEDDFPENDLPENDLPENDYPEYDYPEYDFPESGRAGKELARNGLDSRQVRERMSKGKVNEQIDRTAKTTKDIIKENVFTYFNLIFLIISILLIAAGAFSSLTFLPVVIANTLIGIFQEMHAKKVLDGLSILNEPNAVAIRDGAKTKVPIGKLVLDDVILLEAGNQIPADAVILDGEVAVNEALLTGEADEIVKGSGEELMSGSFIASGRCTAQLTKVGKDSYISKLMLKARKMPVGEQSEMVRSINRIVIAAGILIIPIGLTLFIQSYMTQGNNFSDSVVSMVAAVIGMIPEGLYLLVSVTLATSSVMLARRNIMLHDMKSIETLARVDTLCVDKTGTVTDNSMLVADAVPAQRFTDDQLRRYKALVGEYLEALPDDNITMKAMREYFRGRGSRQAVSIFPFSSKHKYSSVQFTDSTFVLGAPEFVLCEDFPQYSEIVDEYAMKGFRVLVFARYMGEETGAGAKVRRSLPVPKKGLYGRKTEPIFFILLQNPLRENAKKIFGYFAKQGVNVRVISGDNPLTVSEVARQAGIENSESYVDASWLKSDDDIAEAVSKYTVFGRVTPEQKQKIVKALQKEGHTVAMTGDGVNDILAMKSADCSIAMAAGSDAAVQASQVVLLDSDFAHMPQIVSEGRRIINNVQRSATLFLVKNIFSLLLSVFSIINVLVYPLQPSQISLISMFNIGIPAFFLAMERNNRRIEGNFLRNVLFNAMPAALTDFSAIAALVVFGSTFHVAEVDISVASTFLLAIVGFMILFRISTPLNRYRWIVISGCIAGLCFFAYFFSWLFAIQNISTECIMLFVLFAIATEPAMRYLGWLFEQIDKQFEAVADKYRGGQEDDIVLGE